MRERDKKEDGMGGKEVMTSSQEFVIPGSASQLPVSQGASQTKADCLPRIAELWELRGHPEVSVVSASPPTAHYCVISTVSLGSRERDTSGNRRILVLGSSL